MRHTRRRRARALALAGIGLLVMGVVLWAAVTQRLPTRLQYGREVRATEREIRKIEAYQQEHGTYPPEGSGDLSIDGERINIYYHRTGDCYVVGFTIGFDDKREYDGCSKKWRFDW